MALLWKTNGFLAADALQQIAPHLAAVNIDLKAADASRPVGALSLANNPG